MSLIRNNFVKSLIISLSNTKLVIFLNICANVKIICNKINYFRSTKKKLTTFGQLIFLTFPIPHSQFLWNYV